MELRVEHGSDRLREHLPDDVAEHLRARLLLDPLRLSVHVGEAPLAIERVERVGDVLERPHQAGADALGVRFRFSQSRQVLEGAVNALDRAIGPANGLTDLPDGDPAAPWP